MQGSSIEITGTYTHLSVDLRNDGRYFLDLEDSFVIPTYEDVANIDPTQIEVLASYGFSLKYTDANYLALSPFLNASNGSISGAGVDVVATQEGIITPFRKLYVLRVNDSNRTIECSLRFGPSFWVERAENQLIHKIPYAPLLFTYINTRDINENEVQYADGDEGVVFPWVNYGSTYLENTMKVYDLRPHVHLIGLLRKGFKNINHAFSCPYLETDFGRRLICYLLRPEYGNNETNNKRRKLWVTLDQDISVLDQASLYNNIPFNLVNTDPSLAWNYNPTPIFTDASYFWLGSGFIGTIEWGFDIEVKRTQYVDLFRSDNNITTELFIEYPGNEQTLLLHNSPIVDWVKEVVAGEFVWKRSINISLQDMQIPPESKLYVKLFYDYPSKSDVTIKAGAYFKITPTRSIYSEGDTIQLYQELNQELSLMDILRATSHFISGKVYYNYAINRVLLLTPFDADIFGQDIEGYFLSEGYEPIDIDDIVPESMIKEGSELLESYNLTIGYSESTDPAITDFKLLKDGNVQIYDSKQLIGIGGRRTADRYERNPLFEPTINKPYNLYVKIDDNPLLSRYPLDMPYMTDNTPPQGEKTAISFNIAPRIIYAHGYDSLLRVKVLAPEGLPGLYIAGAIMNEADTVTFYAFDVPNMVFSSGDPIDKYFIYGQNKEFDLYTTCWKQYIREGRNNMPYNLLVYLNASNYKRLDFRSRILINYMGSEILGRITRKENYTGGAFGQSTPIVFYPYRSLSTYTPSNDEPLEIRSECDTSNLFLDVAFAAGCYTATMGGSSSSAILNVIFKYKLVSDISYTLGDVICNPSEDITFSMQVVFVDEGCIDFYSTVTISPCQNEAKIVWTYDPIGGCLSLAYDPEYVVSAVNTTVIMVTIDGGIPFLYTVPICDLTDVLLIEANLTLTFTGGCDDVMADDIFAFPPDEYNCDLNVPELDSEILDSCFILPLRTGTIIEVNNTLDLIQYRYSEDDEWQDWDGGTPLNAPVYLARIMMFNNCPTLIIYLYATL